MGNLLLSDRNIDFLLYEVLEIDRRVQAMPDFGEHSRETFDLYVAAARRMAREVLLPSYRAMDVDPPKLVDGRVHVHPRLREIYPQLVALGVTSATRPAAVGGQALPMTVASLASAYLMAGNLSAVGYVGLTAAAAHLLEAFGSPELQGRFMARMYAGEWTGTMALTEPHAGSSLADVTTRATPTGDGSYLVSGSKIFISGGDHDLTENIVQMTLARIDGAPAGIKGVSLFAVPTRRFAGDGATLVDNDVRTAGLVHKIGWRGLPSCILSYGERGDCRGWLVGEPHRGIQYMFQMMNEARIMVGMNGVATASAAYYESLAYARTRTQGRPSSARAAGPQIPIIDHPDVRRMLLRQKAIVEGGLALLAATALHADLAAHSEDDNEKDRSTLLVDLLTPVAKSFPAEWGFEANALAVQIHGGYGYSSEYPVESWLRDQKLNSLHEGTTGIQSLDLLGRKVGAHQGRPFTIFLDEIALAVGRARAAGVGDELCDQMGTSLGWLAEATRVSLERGLAGDVEGMLLHSADYLAAFSIVAVAWVWMWQAAIAAEALRGDAIPRDFYAGKLAACRYWITTELPRVAVHAELCKSGERSFADMRNEWF